MNERSLSWMRVDYQIAPDHFGPLSHADETKPVHALKTLGLDAASSVADTQVNAFSAADQGNAHRCFRSGVFSDIMQCFLHNAVKTQRDLWIQVFRNRASRK